MNYKSLAQKIKKWGLELGFQQIGITNTDVIDADDRLQAWLEKKFHGSMQYLEKNQNLRRHPEQLMPNAVTIICARLNYLPEDPLLQETLAQPKKAYISRYALGRDYHKVMRKKLTQLGRQIETEVGSFGYRAFADSAPVHERELARKAGLGWFGKNTMLMNQDAGPWFFLGELFTDLPLPIDKPYETEHCGRCRACIDACPTDAIVAPYQINASRCISYLTIENKNSIPIEFRKAMGNRIYGCDDCQIFCPFTKFGKTTTEVDFTPRHQLQTADLIDLFAWTEDEFLKRTEGMAIRRATYVGWLRNIAVALANAPTSQAVVDALRARQNYPHPLVREHVSWALAQHHSQSV